jgi:ubiquinone biosynthesis protein
LSRKRAAGRPGERLAVALQEMGPSFIKFGQALSTRPDLIGEDVADDLGQLRDRVPPFAAKVAIETIEKSLDQSVESAFTRFDRHATAAASIAQVHQAVTNNGDDVMVKVLRPGIEDQFRRDIDFFAWIARNLEWLPEFRRLRAIDVVGTFASTVAIEMDLRLEGAAASEMAENFAEDKTFQVPKVDWDRTDRRVLTATRFEGIPIDNREALIVAGRNPEAIVNNLLRAFFNQVFRDGFFHADLHPGNLFVDDDNNICAVDFGITGRLNKGDRRYVAELLFAFLVGDYRRAAEIHFEAGYVPQSQSVDAFAQACRSIGEPVLGREANDLSIGRLLAQLFQITQTFDMQTQPQLLLLQKTLVVIEGVARTLNPGGNVWQMAEPLLEGHVRDQIGPEARLRDGLDEAGSLVRRLPRLVEKAEAAAALVSSEGLRLHPDSARAIAAEQARKRKPWQIAAIVSAAALLLLLIF